MLAPQLLPPQMIDGVEALDGVSEVGTVAAIRMSSREEIQVGVREYHNSRYGEIRVWYWAEGGEKKPSGKGVTFKLELIDCLLEALRGAEENLED